MLCSIADMKPTRSGVQLERTIESVRKKLAALGPLHPGSVSRQYQVCGRPGCRCMDPDHPQRHGPYYKLAYVHRGKPVCRFVRAESVAELKKRLQTYKTFRTLLDRWIELSILQGQEAFFNRSVAAKSKPVRGVPVSPSGENKRGPRRSPRQPAG
jgi:hypothetical protein